MVDSITLSLDDLFALEVITQKNLLIEYDFLLQDNLCTEII
jgi:hypothetical protein